MLGSFFDYPCLGYFTLFVGGNARLAADFVADVADGLGVGCGGGDWKKPGFLLDLGRVAKYLAKTWFLATTRADRINSRRTIAFLCFYCYYLPFFCLYLF